MNTIVERLAPDRSSGVLVPTISEACGADPVYGEGEQPISVGFAFGVLLGGQRDGVDEGEQVVDGHLGADGARLPGPA